ncbi:MAG: 50S ribosomal protein L25 [Candidatus Melainabacteria bacterium]|nr:50S ribosomal protein L25 [Candidatus Melainabacteria bacterium]
MEKFKLKAEKREDKKPNLLRREGNVPATIYGPAVPSESVQVNAREFGRLPAAAYSHLLELEIGDGKPVSVIIRNVQRKSTSDQVINVEFYRVSLDKKLHVSVPIHFVGVSPAVATKGAQFLESHVTVDIECMPGDIPDFIECDISSLKDLDSAVTFHELKLPKSVTVLNPPDEIVARAVTPRTTAQEDTTAAALEPEKAAEAEEKAEEEKEEKKDGE